MATLTGQTIRGYVLREQIGGGGFATVFRAHQPAVERDVAIKIILPKFSNDPEFVRRFETEAQLIARLEHPHIVPLYDFWREPNNAFLVMRWLRGGNLYETIRDHGARPLPDVVRMLDQIASALAAAHHQGVIHQDITPANILFDERQNAYLADFGIARDLVTAWEMDSSDTLYGSPAYIAPERFEQDESTPQTDIYSLGIVLYEMLTGRHPFYAPTTAQLINHQKYATLPPLAQHSSGLPPMLDPVLLRATAKIPRLRHPDVMSFAADFRQAIGQRESPEPAPDGHVAAASDDSPLKGPVTLVLGTPTIAFDRTVSAPNPYKGLRPFDEADAANFFGRENLVQRLLDRISSGQTPFLAVVGPSGSGKSSVVKAGLLPPLRAGAVEGSEHWFVAKLVPGTNPFKELESALLQVAFDDSTELATELRGSDQGLHHVVRRILPDDESRLVLVIDQLEELFTQVNDVRVRGQFLASLVAAVQAPNSRVLVIVTLRADFYDRPLQYAEFGQLLSQSTEIVLPLTAAEQQAAIIEPARRADLTLESGLVAEILADVNAQPGALPLMQYALTELFNNRSGQMLTLEAYRNSGGVTGAVARRAEALYGDMRPNQQAAAQQLFLRLVTLGEGTDDTRRRARWAELTGAQQVDKATMNAVIDQYGMARLLTFDRDPHTREPTVEIAHEALIRQWERLQSWIDDNREGLHAQQQLADAAHDWIASGSQPGFLATGARLARFETLLDAPIIALTGDETAFLTASMTLRQRAVRRRQQVIAVLVTLTVAAVIFAAVALAQRNRAENARRQAVTQRDRADVQAAVARSRELAANSLAQQDQLDLALLLGIEAMHAADTLEARSNLLSVLEASDYLLAFLHGHSSPVRAVAISPDGALVVAGARDGRLLAWDTASHQPSETPFAYDGGRVNSLVFDPAGDTLAAGADSGQLWVWDTATGEMRFEPVAAHDDSLWSVAFSPDGQTLATGGADGSVRLWRADSGEPISEPLTGHTDAVLSVAFSPDGGLLASGSMDGTIRLWDVATGAPAGDALTGHDGWVYSVAFSPDGRLLASGGADTTVRTWTITPAIKPAAVFEGHDEAVRSVVFSPDGMLVVSGSDDGSLRVWDRMSGVAVGAPLHHHTDAVWSVAFSSDNRTVASSGADGRVILWDLNRYNQVGQIVPAHEQSILTIAASPDGRLVASGSGGGPGIGTDNTVRLWDAHSRALIAMFGPLPAPVNSLAFSPDSRLLASATTDGGLVIWDAETGQPALETSPVPGSPIMSLAFHPTQPTLAVGYEDGAILLVGTESRSDPAILRAADSNSALALAFDPVRGVLLSGHRDGTVWAWDTEQKRPAGDPLQAHAEPVTSLALSPDGTLIATGSRDATIGLWDAATYAPRHPPLAGHDNWVLSVAFSGDGQQLVSGGRDGLVMLWDVALGRPVGQPLELHSDWVTGVAYVPSSDLVVSGSWDMTIGWWNLGTADWIARACAIANRDMSPDERQRFAFDASTTPTCPDVQTR